MYDDFAFGPPADAFFFFFDGFMLAFSGLDATAASNRACGVQEERAFVVCRRRAGVGAWRIAGAPSGVGEPAGICWSARRARG